MSKKQNGMNKVAEYKATIRRFLSSEEFKNRLFAILGSERKRERFVATLLNVAMNPDLVGQVDPVTVVQAGLEIAELDLSLTPSLGQAYIVKYKYKAQPIVGYKGWMTLARRAGIYVKAFPVFKCDKFSVEIDGWEEKVRLIPNYKEHKEEDDQWVAENLGGVLVSIKDKEEIFNKFVPLEKILKIAGYSKSLESEYSPWNNWKLEMFMAKALKYVISKYPVMSEQEVIGKALEIDNRLDTERFYDNFHNGFSPEVVPLDRELEGLKERIKQLEGGEAKTIEQPKEEKEKEKVEKEEKPKEEKQVNKSNGGLL